MPTTSLYEHATNVPIDPIALREREATARTITLYAPAVLPDLLLTADYARALLHRDPTIPTTEVHDRVAAILHRQDVVFRDGGPTVRVFVNLAALMSEVADYDTTMAQRDHLVKLLRHQGRTLTVRVIPDGYTPTDRFALLEPADSGPAVYTASAVTELVLTRPEHITAYRAILDRLDDAAWMGPASRTFLAELTAHHPADVETAEQAEAWAASLGLAEEA